MQARRERWRWIAAKLRLHWAALLGVVILSSGGVAFSLLFANSTKELIDRATQEHNFFVSGIVVLVVYKLLQLGFEQGDFYVRSLTRSILENDLVYRYTLKFLRSDVSDSQKYHTGDKLYRISNDSGAVAECIAYNLPMLVYAVVLFFSTTVYLFIQDARLTVVLCLLSPVLLATGAIYSRLLIPAERKVREAGSGIMASIEEHLKHQEIIYVYRAASFISSGIAALQREYLRCIKRKLRIIIGADSLSEGCLSVSYLVIVIWGVIGLSGGSLQFGEFIVFLQLTGQMQRPFFLFKDQMSSAIGSCASMDRLKEIDRLKNTDSRRSRILATSFETLQADDVSFSYTERQEGVIENLTINVPRGELIGIFGRTGIGKTTLFRLLLGILTPVSGKIFFNINGAKTEVSQQTVDNFAYVPQGNSIISGSIRYNLSLFNATATDDMMREALHSACADFVFDDFPEGLDTLVGEKGIGLSEGQAHRIAIAGGILSGRKIMLLDEPTAALDPTTERELMKRLAEKRGELTIIIITHQRKLAEWFDSVIDLDKTNNN